MIDTTKEIQTTTQVEWDDIRKLRSSSSCRHLFSGKEEIHKQVLYLHVMKNKTKKKASTRTIDIQDDYLPFITEWMQQIKNFDNPYLLSDSI